MKKHIITEDQMAQLANILGEFPAKAVISAIDILRSLPKLEKTSENLEIGGIDDGN